MSDRQCWATSPELFSAFDREFHFDLDVCADASNTKCAKFYDEAQDGLKQPWACRAAWCNPGFSNVEPWILKAIKEYGSYDYAVILAPSSHSAWYRLAFETAWQIRQLWPRPNFLPPAGIKASSNARDIIAIIYASRYRPPCKVYPWSWKT